MKRITLSLLIAYAVAITVIAAWSGCRGSVLQRICAMSVWLRPGGLPVVSFEEVQTFSGVAGSMTEPVDSAMIGLANIHSAQIAAVSGLAMSACFAFTIARRNSQKPPDPTLS